MSELTDEQIDADMTGAEIDAALDVARWAYHKHAGYGTPAFDTLIAAVETRAARRERERIATEIATAIPYNAELRPDGTEDHDTAIYVGALHDAWRIAKGDPR